jgi:hypothetical protein
MVLYPIVETLVFRPSLKVCCLRSCEMTDELLAALIQQL